MNDARIATRLPTHPKMKKLIRRLGDGAAWKLICLWLWTADARPNGDLSGMTDEDIELAADWTGENDLFVATLADLRFLDGAAGARRLHDWADHNPWVNGADLRSAKAKWKAILRHHGMAEADRQVPEYAAVRHARSTENDAGSTKNDAASTEKGAGSKSGAKSVQTVPDASSTENDAGSNAAASKTDAPSPSPSPSPKSKSKKPCPAGAARFAEFWAVYPRREARKQALDVWQRKRLDERADALIADVEKRKREHRPWLEGYVPHAVVYLRNERWDDEIDQSRPRSPPAEPSKSMQAIQKLREASNGNQLDFGRIEHRAAEADLPAPEGPTRG